MRDSDGPGAEDRICGIVRQMLPPTHAAADLGPHRSLSEAGLKSLDLVTLMLAVEVEFEVEIPQEEMTPENFRSIAAIRELIASLTASA
jgi:acyl carrier protein